MDRTLVFWLTMLALWVVGPMVMVLVRFWPW